MNNLTECRLHSNRVRYSLVELVQYSSAIVSLLSLSVFAVVVPAAFVRSGSNVDTAGVVAISRATAIVLLICYAAYLVFQLFTHRYLYTLHASKLNATVTYAEGVAPTKKTNVFSFGARKMLAEKLHKTSDDGKSSDNNHASSSTERHVTGQNITASPRMETQPLPPITDKKNDDPSPSSTAVSPAIRQAAEEENKEQEEEEETPQLTVWLAVVLLLVVTIITGVTAEFLVSSIDGMTSRSHVNKEFVALILLPLVVRALATFLIQLTSLIGKCVSTLNDTSGCFQVTKILHSAEHVTAVTVSVKNKLGTFLARVMAHSLTVRRFSHGCRNWQ